MKKTILYGLPALFAVVLLAAFSRLTGSSVKPQPVQNEAFLKFLKQFKPEHLPYAITKASLLQYLKTLQPEAGGETEANPQQKAEQEWVRLEDPDHFIPFDRMAMISRAPVFYAPLTKMETPEYVAVVYTVTIGFSKVFKDYEIAVFDKQGQFVSKNHLAHLSAQALTACTVNVKLVARTQQYAVVWARNLDEFGMEGNRVAGLTQESAEEIDLTLPTEGSKLPRIKKQPESLPSTESIGAVSY